MSDVVQCAGALVHDPDGRLLLVRRANEPSRGLWCEPSGRCEPGESAREAAVRETFEETGLHVRVERSVGSVRLGHYELEDFVCTVEGGTLRAGDDAADVRWVDAASFAQLPLVPDLAEILARWDCLPRC